MEHAEAVKLIKDYGFAVLKHQNNWLGGAYEALLNALLAASAPTPSAEPVAWYRQTDITELTDSEPETDGWTPLYAAPPAQSAEQDRIDAEPVGYIEPQSLEYLNDPAFAEEPESHVRLWHPSNPPSRAIIPVFLAKDKK
jgi:hypothetical protein